MFYVITVLATFLLLWCGNMNKATHTRVYWTYCVGAHYYHVGMHSIRWVEWCWSRSWEFTSWDPTSRHTGIAWASENSNPTHSVTPPPTTPYLLIRPKQFHQLGPSIQIYQPNRAGRAFSFKPQHLQMAKDKGFTGNYAFPRLKHWLFILSTLCCADWWFDGATNFKCFHFRHTLPGRPLRRKASGPAARIYT